MENRIKKRTVKEELYTIDGNDFKRITYDDGEQIYKGFDKNFDAWITLRFRQIDDSEVIEKIKQHAYLLIGEGEI